MPQVGVGGAEHLRHIDGVRAGEADGVAIAADGVLLDGDLVLDGLVGMGRMIEVEGVLGSDHPMGGSDAAVGGAEGDAPGAGRAGERFEAAAGEAAMKFIGMGKNLAAQAQPGFTNGAQNVFPPHFSPPEFWFPEEG
jgi:hypothetical protein